MPKTKKTTSPSKSPLIFYLGIILICIGVFIFLAILSYLFTWKIDQDKIQMGLLSLLKSSDIKCENLFGKVGAYISHHLVYNALGIWSFSVPFILFLLGIKTSFKTWMIKPLWAVKQFLIIGLVFPVFFGLLLKQHTHFLSGKYGYYLSSFIENTLGFLGGMIFCLGGLIMFVHYFYPQVFSQLSSFFKRKPSTSPLQSKTPTHHQTDLMVSEPLLDSTKKVLDATDKSIDFSIEHNPPITDSLPLEKNIPPKNTTTHSTLKEPEANIDLEIQETTSEPTSSKAEQGKIDSLYDPTLDLGDFKMPHTNLLIDYPSDQASVDREELEQNKNRIVKTLKDYKIEIAKIKATIGPTVTLYEIVPAAGVRISKIKNLEDDIALSLSALGIRIIAPIPGRGTVGIEVPNQKSEIVSIKSVLSSEKFLESKMDLPLALGKTISNETYIADLAKMPHLLMAGATGQGKSVGLNTILVSLLYKKHPSQIKFVLVDPKKVELTLFNKIEKHYLAKLPGEQEAIITDTKKVITTLNALCIEMDERYDLLKKAMVRNLKEYNSKFIQRKLNPQNGHKFLPYIVLVIDEFADLIMTAGKEVETPIARLAQLARAIGIHLIIATQRPSVNIITGIIKANFPSRIAFRVTSKIDSRTILDAGGADQLIGKGDMLLSLGNDLIRVQCAFVDTPEVEEICTFIGNQRGYVQGFELPEYTDASGSKDNALDLDDRDEMFEEAARLVIGTQQGSTSMIQRKLKLGYNRAGRIMDQLEAAGIVGPSEGSKARQVLFPDEYTLEQYLRDL